MKNVHPDPPRSAADGRRGWGPWRRDWYSLCSSHQRFEPKCVICHFGRWVWRVPHLVSSFFFWLTPDLWRKWANRSRKG